ncbi:MAG: hypothetical protein A2566_03370 [Candidatus Zambryskibacteria bacterium RIFOXYD1_FULL_40_13]|nr:MAG: hypothetical protein UT25_C0002G0014 [Parcubacteria group bacterium GW2011_GWC1_39_12]KKR19487.1 MAG: hypothetical protein UT49_C0002G0333 [Parcubacteria group bacterium GW2011_GWF1_39_37]KKR35113.1 MAG: hypothetical protein UT68_C0005G0062 [Parcubacteria group bacterium GW2011_GWC2_40_10]KKR52436.1 MAG: hypothetical protein UT89_C0002G0237 [Parcubacteria group bacterium GW2011_GWE1_40_20]KKR65893.1 MAG: hypothetical protein UU06_C0009G0010 [Parcubacteria group bacterium GW2011_GWB1_40_
MQNGVIYIQTNLALGGAITMRTRCFLAVLALVAIFASAGCTLHVNGRPYTFGALEGVKVSNNTAYVGDIERNNDVYCEAVPVGQFCYVPFGMGPSVIVTFRAYQPTVVGKGRYIGMAEQIFYARNRIGDNQSWMVTQVQQPVR